MPLKRECFFLIEANNLGAGQVPRACKRGIVALRLTQPIVLLALSANMAGIVFIFSSLHLLYINTRLLPVELRPPLGRRCALVAIALFYGLFLALWLWSLL